MACRAGAARVYAVEETSILDLARSLAAANGYGDRCIPVRAHSRRARLPERADVVLSETIGAFVFSEDILSSLADARERFLKPGGVLVPEGVKVSLAPVETFEEGVGLLERPVRGFDFRPAAALVPTETMIAARRVRSSHFLDSERVLYEIDFRTAGADGDFDRELEFTAGRDGVLHGFAGYWEATLHGDIRLGVLPDGPARHWTPLLFRLPAGLPVARDDRILLRFGRKDRPGWVWRWSARVERPVPR
jgi:protein arginine N-methyltransferase 1